MKTLLIRLSALAIGALCLSCTPEPPVEPTSSGGSPGSGGQPGSGGTVVATGGTALATGGTASGGTATGGTSSGGTASGGTATGGSATGGAATGGKATGGGSTGGSSNSGPAYMPAFIIGADISRVQQTEDGGTRFRDVHKGHSDLVLEIGLRLAYYGQTAHKNDLGFVTETAAHDLAVLCERAFVRDIACHDSLLG